MDSGYPETVVRENPLNGQSPLVTHFMWKERRFKDRIFMDSRTVGNDCGCWKGQDWKITDKEVWGSRP